MSMKKNLSMLERVPLLSKPYRDKAFAPPSPTATALALWLD